jgi:hypothetical protein
MPKVDSGTAIFGGTAFHHEAAALRHRWENSSKLVGGWILSRHSRSRDLTTDVHERGITQGSLVRANAAQKPTTTDVNKVAGSFSAGVVDGCGKIAPTSIVWRAWSTETDTSSLPRRKNQPPGAPPTKPELDVVLHSAFCRGSAGRRTRRIAHFHIYFLLPDIHHTNSTSRTQFWPFEQNQTRFSFPFRAHIGQLSFFWRNNTFFFFAKKLSLGFRETAILASIFAGFMQNNMSSCHLSSNFFKYLDS